MKRVAILTSGGDAPGMNAATRVIVHTGIQRGLEVIGARHGFRGLMAGDFIPLERNAVDGIMQLGGTMLGTSRCDEFKTPGGQEQAERALRTHQIAALIVIGGNGSQSGAHALAQRGVQIIGVASTIDNDLVGTDISIGTTTAQQVAMESIDRLRVSAISHQRAFLVEVMGRHSGHLATAAAIAGGAEAFIAPESELTPEMLAARLWQLHERGQKHAIVVVSEGSKRNAQSLANYFTTNATALPFELRVTRLGHLQRGGAPNVYDRILASRLGIGAIEHLLAGSVNVLIGLRDGIVQSTPLVHVAGRTQSADPQLLAVANALTH
jgi:6-phosphofructokinase 1